MKPNYSLKSSLKKPVAFSVVAHLLLLGAVWTLPRNSELANKLESLPLEIFENIKDQAPLKKFSQNIKQKIVKIEKVKPLDDGFEQNKNEKNIHAIDLPTAQTSTSVTALGSSTASLVDGTQVTVRAKLLNDHKVPYPQDAKANEIEGPVVMDLVIDNHGKVIDVKLVRGPGHGLNEAAIEATSKFVFMPAMIGDKPVAVRIRYTYRFVLDTR